MNLSRDDIDQIAAAANAVGYSLNPEDRFDLKQEIAIKLLQIPAPQSVHAWSLKFARDWVANLLRDRRIRRELLEEGKPRGAVQTYRKGPNWSPTWYPPHPDAQQFAPFAMETARVMYVKKQDG